MIKKKPQSKKSQLIFFLIFLFALGAAKLWQYHLSDALITVDGDPLYVLVAKNRYQHKKGLGGRESLGKYDGMIFLFSIPKKYGFVMRDMEFPIDIIWFFNGEVIDFVQNVQLEPGASEESLKRYYPRKEANLVLEVPSGWSREHGLKIGDRIDVIEE